MVTFRTKNLGAHSSEEYYRIEEFYAYKQTNNHTLLVFISSYSSIVDKPTSTQQAIAVP